MADARRFTLPGGVAVHVSFTDRADGDLSIHEEPAALDTRRSAVAPTPWTWLEQVHGARVVGVESPGDGAGTAADASVTDRPGCVLSVQTADCAPVLLFAPGPSGAVVAAAHAGWKGIEAGVLPAVVDRMRSLGAGAVSWTLGPCISAGEYEFSLGDLHRLEARFGKSVRSVTHSGTPALDVRAAVRRSLEAAGVTSEPVGRAPACTASSTEYWSHRARAAFGRQAGVMWWESGADG